MSHSVHHLPLPFASALAVLQPIEAAGKLDAVNRVRETIGAVFQHAIQTARAKADPTQAF
jgi:hypothetical protein